jgi:hypothetical protein
MPTLAAIYHLGHKGEPLTPAGGLVFLTSS